MFEWLKKRYLRWALYFDRQPPLLEKVFDFESNDPHLNSFLPHAVELQMEHPIGIVKLQKNSDRVFFAGFNSAGSILVCSIERHRDGTAEMFILLRLPDGRTFVRPENAVCVDVSRDDMFACGGLKLICSVPMIRWRLVFTGTLRELCHDGSLKNEETFVHFGFYVNNNVSSADFRYFVDEEYMSKQWAKQGFTFTPGIRQTLDQLFVHSQAMFFAGTILVNDDKYEVALWGYKTRSILSEKDGIEPRGNFVAVTQNGLQLDVHKVLLPSWSNSLYFGHLRTPFPQETPIGDISPSDIFKSEVSCERSFIVKANRLSLPVKLDVPICSTKMLRRHDGYVYEVPIIISPATIDDNGGWAIFIGSHRNQTIVQERPSLPACLQLEREVSLMPFSSVPLVVSFDEKQCTLVEVSGGKGSSLAMLTQVANKTTDEFIKFKVPRGLVLSTNSYREFCSQKNVSELIGLVEKHASGGNLENLKNVCADVMEKMSQISLPAQIANQLEYKLGQVFGSQEFVGMSKFAVRSSACGEDSEETSAAGQMTTFLGVKGFQNICQAVVKCWASQFGFVAVQYKIQHGSELNAAMAVVVQEMVDSEFSGVLFTSNPINGDPRIMTITANYGLGESVVSATADPDTIWVRRSLSRGLSIDRVNIGKKKIKIVTKEDGGTTETEVEQKQAGESCISNENILRLARLGLSLEHAYASPRDIEWAFKENAIYLLQSRPITALDKETYFELLHERNYGIFSEKEVLTKANIGEVMPGSLAPLSFSGGVFLDFRRYEQGEHLKQGVSRAGNPRLPKWFFKCAATHIFFNTMFSVADPSKTDFVTQGLVLGIFGREDIDEEAINCNKEKWRYILPEKFGYSKTGWLYLIPRAYKVLKKSEEIVARKNFATISDTDSALDNFRKIITHLPGGLVLHSHQACIMYSTFGNVINLALLASTEKGYNNKVYGDFAKITQNCNNLVSAEIPLTLQQIAKTIEMESDPASFKQLTPEFLQDALKWIQTNGSKTSLMFEEFLERHGHRCLGEFDLAVMPWCIDPIPVVRTIQGLVGSVESEHRQEMTATAIVNSLDVKLGFIKSEFITETGFRLYFVWRKNVSARNFVTAKNKDGLVMKMFGVRLTRNGIAYRERAKSALILCQHRIRVAYLRLGKQMRSEGLIPDAHLIFFFELWDLYRVLTKHPRTAELISRAITRRRLAEREYPKIYPEINPAVPIPISEKKIVQIDGDKKMTGTPVSQGKTTGRACVITKLEDAHQIQKGDILITYATDVGWSPYFPLISGIATELGGLISHGAVVAREYGIPCVVAVHGATQLFETGDTVYLDGDKGILQTVEITS